MQRRGLHPEVDAGEEARALIGAVKDLGDERLLFQVQERRHPRHEYHEGHDAEQVRRARHLHEGGEHAAAHAALSAGRAAVQRRRAGGRLAPLPADHQRHEQQRHQQQARRQRQQVDGPERDRKLAVNERANQAAGAGPRPDEAEQAPRLLAGVHIRHQAPERRHYKKIEDAHPDEVRARDPGVLVLHMKPQPEQDEVGREEAVHPRQEHRPRQARGEPAVHRLQQQHDDEHSPEEIRDVVEA